MGLLPLIAPPFGPLKKTSLHRSAPFGQVAQHSDEINLCVRKISGVVPPLLMAKGDSLSIFSTRLGMRFKRQIVIFDIFPLF